MEELLILDGESTCPRIDRTEEVYSGITGGSSWTHSGGGSNYFSMPKVPEYTLPYSSSGSEYKLIFMELSINTLLKVAMVTIFPVLSVMCPTGQQYS